MSILKDSFIQYIIKFLKSKIEAKQDKLVSGSNIKTINGTSVLGAGNIAIEGGGDFDSSGSYPNLTAGKATKLATARTISLSGGASGSVSFDGSANRSIDVTFVREAYLSYGGKAIAGDISPIDSAAVTEFWCNKLAYYNPDYIHVEYTNNYSEDADGNESSDVIWTDYPFVNENVRLDRLFRLVTSGDGTLFSSGSSSNGTAIAGKTRLRVTFSAYSGRYIAPKKLLIRVGASVPSLNNQIKVEAVTKADYDAGNIDKFTHSSTNVVAGDSGWNSMTFASSFGVATYASVKKIRITFIINEVDTTSRPPVLYNIYMIGKHHSVYDDTLAETGHMYDYDWQKNVTFPANVTATKHITQGGSANQVVLGDGTLRPISELSPITDADADILLDNHIHSINAYANGNNVNISVIESSKNGNTWETEDNDITIPLATTTSAGVMSKEDKAKLDGNISIEPNSGMPDFIGDFEYSDVDYEAIIDLTTVDWINWVEGGLFVMNAEETWEEDNGDTSYHQCVVTFIYRANGCIPISIVNTNKMTAKMSGMVITINLTEGTGELRFKQIKLI
jgi:hypothetical protein